MVYEKEHYLIRILGTPTLTHHSIFDLGICIQCTKYIYHTHKPFILHPTTLLTRSRSIRSLSQDSKHWRLLLSREGSIAQQGSGALVAHHNDE